MFLLVLISGLIVFGCGLFARLRARPWWLWVIWFGVALAAFITLAALEPTWREALAVVAVSSVVGLLGPEVRRVLWWLTPRIGRALWWTIRGIARGIWRAIRSVLRDIWRWLRRWIRQKPIRALYLLGGLALLVSPINPQLGGSALALVLVIIGLRVMFLGFRPTRPRGSRRR